jgi:ABC-type branched-subunit amino acid transport system substrate-binding protein
LSSIAADIPVGAIFPMTGGIATYGQESINGINLALKKINKSGIKGSKIRLIVEDDKGEPVDCDRFESDSDSDLDLTNARLSA